MKLTLLSKYDFSGMVLPEKFAGHYRLRGRNSTGKLMDVVSVEALRSTEGNGPPGWVMKSNRRFRIVDRNQRYLPGVTLQPLELYFIRSADGSLSYTVFTEPLSLDRKQYKGYKLSGESAVLSVGREGSNNICYENRFVSGSHAQLTIARDEIHIRDLGSTNSTYVNGKAVKDARLISGDVVFIMGLQIVVTNCGIFLNNPDGKVKVRSEELCEFHVEPFSAANADDEFEDLQSEYYYRAPRFKHDVDEFKIKIDPPPANQDNDDIPMIMLVGPALTMGMAAIASGAFAVISAMSRGDFLSAMPSIVMSVSMLMGTLMWPLITKTYQKRLRRKKEAKRQKTYKEYLEHLRELIAGETSRQERILRENDVSASVHASRILASNPQMWERTPKHKDFLSLHLGYGNMPLKANIQYPERKFTVERDNLTEMMYQFGETRHWLTNVPICLNLPERFISGIYADRRDLFMYAKNLILQIVSLHSYDEVKLVLLIDESTLEEFAFVRLLPHVMNDEKTVRYLATNSEEAKELSSNLDTIIEYRKELSDHRLADESPYFVIICLDKELSTKTECVRRVLEYKNNIKFSVLSLFERLVDLPKECSAVVEIRGGTSGNMTLLGDVSETPIPFRVDVDYQPDFRGIVKVLSNTFVDIGDSNFSIPKKYTFFEMLDIGMIEHLNLIENWMANDPTKSLAATIGVDKYGEPFRLDLHERAHGPHGLVAGMTGSGKSEFIISYILSMAVTFHPHEVAFILIDYKGGGMAESFENIPHTAGVITNLDGNGIKRSLASMRSELHRRERIFRDTSQQHNISNIDIYKYQKLFRERKVAEPLPHLFIISDEFAELKKEQPDFMTELTSTARVGRSLGVHLILATQKPGGVVDDQIRSNSRFRVCLKVQDVGDSSEMLGRPEAAALVDTGRFYLQVGYNELFEIGQSAWAGAPYYPSAKVIKDRDDAVSVINTNGRVVAEANIERFPMVKDPPKQLDVVTNYIKKISDEEKIGRWKMWLDPIPSDIYVDELVRKYGYADDRGYVLNPVVGEYDDPAHQAQGILSVPITADGNVIIYGSAGSGKAMFVEAMCYSLINNHSPSEVNVYIMDFGAETLTAFSECPHVGDVILSYETEKVENLFKLLIGKLGTRKKLLSRLGGDMLQYNLQAEKPEPSIVVVVNNYAAFNELFEDKSAEMGYLTREGTKYGIYFVLTSTGVNSVRFSLLQNFKSMYCLQLNNADDYASVVGKTDGLLPEKWKGRGLFRSDPKTLLEFQTAGILNKDSSYAAIKTFAGRMSEKYAHFSAVRVPVLPEKVTKEFISNYVEAGNLNRVPVGVEKATLDISYYNFESGVVTLVLSLEQEWKKFTGALAELVASKCNVKTYILDSGFASGVDSILREEMSNLTIFSNTQGCVEAVFELFDEVVRRNNLYKENLDAGLATPVFDPIFVLIHSMSALKSMLERYRFSENSKKYGDDDTPLNRLQMAMAKCVREYKVYFVVAESVSTLTSFTVEDWYKTHISGNSGLWVGSGIGSQYRISVSKKSSEHSVDLGSDFGFAVQNGTATLIKLLE